MEKTVRDYDNSDTSAVDRNSKLTKAKFTHMDELHTWWEVPSIAHFFSLFKESFGLVDIEIEELEEWLIEAGTDKGCPFLIDLLCRLLKGCYNGRKQITHENFEFHFRDIIKKKWETEQGRENPFYQNDMNFQKLPLKVKVEMMHALCDYRLYAEDVVDKLKTFEVDDLRKTPVGRDSSGALYWYFYGTRLYKEIPATQDTQTPKKKETKRSRQTKDLKEDESLTPQKKQLPGRRAPKTVKVADPKVKSSRGGAAKRGHLPRRIEELMLAEGSTESDSSLSQYSRRSPVLPPALHLEEPQLSDSTMQSYASNNMAEDNVTKSSASPPKLTPQMSACSQNNSDSEASSLGQGKKRKKRSKTPKPEKQIPGGQKSRKRMEDIISKLQQSLPTEVQSDNESVASSSSLRASQRKKCRPPKLKEEEDNLKSEDKVNKKVDQDESMDTHSRSVTPISSKEEQPSTKNTTGDEVQNKDNISDNESVVSSTSQTSKVQKKSKGTNVKSKTKTSENVDKREGSISPVHGAAKRKSRQNSKQKSDPQKKAASPESSSQSEKCENYSKNKMDVSNSENSTEVEKCAKVTENVQKDETLTKNVSETVDENSKDKNIACNDPPLPKLEKQCGKIGKSKRKEPILTTSNSVALESEAPLITDKDNLDNLPPKLTAIVKTTSESYNVDEPLDLSKKSSENSSAIQTTSDTVNGIIPDKIQSGANSPLNLSKSCSSKDSKSKQIYQMDGICDISSSSDCDSDMDTFLSFHKMCCKSGSDDEYHLSFKTVFCHDESVQSCGYMLNFAEQLDGQNDPNDPDSGGDEEKESTSNQQIPNTSSGENDPEIGIKIGSVLSLKDSSFSNINSTELTNENTPEEDEYNESQSSSNVKINGDLESSNSPVVSCHSEGVNKDSEDINNIDTGKDESLPVNGDGLTSSGSNLAGKEKELNGRASVETNESAENVCNGASNAETSSNDINVRSSEAPECQNEINHFAPNPIIIQPPGAGDELPDTRDHTLESNSAAATESYVTNVNNQSLPGDKSTSEITEGVHQENVNNPEEENVNKPEETTDSNLEHDLNLQKQISAESRLDIEANGNEANQEDGPNENSNASPEKDSVASPSESPSKLMDMFEMECDDVDGDGESTTLNKIIIPRVVTVIKPTVIEPAADDDIHTAVQEGETMANSDNLGKRSRGRPKKGSTPPIKKAAPKKTVAKKSTTQSPRVKKPAMFVDLTNDDDDSEPEIVQVQKPEIKNTEIKIMNSFSILVSPEASSQSADKVPDASTFESVNSVTTSANSEKEPGKNTPQNKETPKDTEKLEETPSNSSQTQVNEEDNTSQPTVPNKPAITSLPNVTFEEDFEPPSLATKPMNVDKTQSETVTDVDKVDKKETPCENTVVITPKIEAKYLSAPKRQVTQSPERKMSFTDCFSAFLAKMGVPSDGGSKPSKSEVTYIDDNSNGSSSRSGVNSNRRSSVASSTSKQGGEDRKSTSRRGRGRGRGRGGRGRSKRDWDSANTEDSLDDIEPDSWKEEPSKSRGKGGPHKKPRKSKEESEEEMSEGALTDEQDQVEDEEEDAIQDPAGDFLPPIVTKLKKRARAGTDSKDSSESEMTPRRRSGRRTVKKINYCVDLEPSSPSPSEKSLVSSQQVSEDEGATEDEEAAESVPSTEAEMEEDKTKKKPTIEAEANGSTHHDSDTEVETENSKENTNTDDSETEKEEASKGLEEVDEIVKIVALKSLQENEEKQKRTSKRRKSRKYFNDSDDYIISEEDAESDNGSLGKKPSSAPRGRRRGRGGRRGRGRGLKQTIDYICAQLDGPGDSPPRSKKDNSPEHSMSESDTDARVSKDESLADSSVVAEKDQQNIDSDKFVTQSVKDKNVSCENVDSEKVDTKKDNKVEPCPSERECKDTVGKSDTSISSVLDKNKDAKEEISMDVESNDEATISDGKQKSTDNISDKIITEDNNMKKEVDSEKVIKVNEKLKNKTVPQEKETKLSDKGTKQNSPEKKKKDSGTSDVKSEDSSNTDFEKLKNKAIGNKETFPIEKETNLSDKGTRNKSPEKKKKDSGTSDVKTEDSSNIASEKLKNTLMGNKETVPEEKETKFSDKGSRRKSPEKKRKDSGTSNVKTEDSSSIDSEKLKNKLIVNKETAPEEKETKLSDKGSRRKSPEKKKKDSGTSNVKEEERSNTDSEKLKNKVIGYKETAPEEKETKLSDRGTRRKSPEKKKKESDTSNVKMEDSSNIDSEKLKNKVIDKETVPEEKGTKLCDKGSRRKSPEKKKKDRGTSDVKEEDCCNTDSETFKKKVVGKETLREEKETKLSDKGTKKKSEMKKDSGTSNVKEEDSCNTDSEKLKNIVIGNKKTVLEEKETKLSDKGTRKKSPEKKKDSGSSGFKEEDSCKMEVDEKESDIEESQQKPITKSSKSKTPAPKVTRAATRKSTRKITKVVRDDDTVSDKDEEFKQAIEMSKAELRVKEQQRKQSESDSSVSPTRKGAKTLSMSQESQSKNSLQINERVKKDTPKKQNIKDEKADSETENESPKPKSKRQIARARSRKSAVQTAEVCPQRSSPRKRNSLQSKNFIDRLKNEDLETGSDTMDYTEAGRIKGDEESSSGESDGTEDYWSEDEELLKVDPSAIESFNKNWDRKTQWNLICENLDDWKCFAKKFKDSDVRCEKALYKCVMEDFLPEMPKLIDYKEGQKKDRLKELAKLKEKIRKQSLGEIGTEDDTSGDESDVKKEQHLKWQREEEEKELKAAKQRLTAERARRAKIRELRAEGKTDDETKDGDDEAEGESEPSSSSSEEEIETSDRQLRKRTRRTGVIKELDAGLDEHTITLLSKVLQAVQDHEDAWPFADQVEEAYAPGYYEQIEEPIWLGRIEEKLDMGLYQSVAEFEADFQLMWDNCEQYNGLDSEYTEVSVLLDKVFRRSMKRHLPKWKSSLDEPTRKETSSNKKTPWPAAPNKRGTAKETPSNKRSKRTASSQARDAIKVAEMSSEEEEEESETTPEKAQKSDTGNIKNKAGLYVAPAPEKCGVGPSEIVQIQKVDRNNPNAAPLPGYNPQHMGPNGPVIGPQGPWHPGMRPPHMGPQGMHPSQQGYYGGGNMPTNGPQIGYRGPGPHMGPNGPYMGQGQPPMRPPMGQQHMGGMQGGNMGPNGQYMAAPQRYPGGHYGPGGPYGTPMQGQGQMMNQMPGYGPNRPPMMGPQGVPMSHSVPMPGPPHQHQPPSSVDGQGLPPSMGSPCRSDRTHSPSGSSPALSQLNSRLTSPGAMPSSLPPQVTSPGMRSDSDRVTSPALSSPGPGTPNTTPHNMPGSPNMMRPSNAANMVKRDLRMGSPPHHGMPGMYGPARQPQPGYQPHMMGYRPGGMRYPGGQPMMRHPNDPGMRMMGAGYPMQRMPPMQGGPPRGSMFPPGQPPTNPEQMGMNPTMGPPTSGSSINNEFQPPGMFTSMLQELDDLPPPPPVSAAQMGGPFPQMSGPRMPPVSAMNSMQNMGQPIANQASSMNPPMASVGGGFSAMNKPMTGPVTSGIDQSRESVMPQSRNMFVSTLDSPVDSKVSGTASKMVTTVSSNDSVQSLLPGISTEISKTEQSVASLASGAITSVSASVCGTSQTCSDTTDPIKVQSISAKDNTTAGDITSKSDGNNAEQSGPSSDESMETTGSDKDEFKNATQSKVESEASLSNSEQTVANEEKSKDSSSNVVNESVKESDKSEMEVKQEDNSHLLPKYTSEGSNEETEISVANKSEKSLDSDKCTNDPQQKDDSEVAETNDSNSTEIPNSSAPEQNFLLNQLLEQPNPVPKSTLKTNSPPPSSMQSSVAGTVTSSTSVTSSQAVPITSPSTMESASNVARGSLAGHYPYPPAPGPMVGNPTGMQMQQPMRPGMMHPGMATSPQQQHPNRPPHPGMMSGQRPPSSYPPQWGPYGGQQPNPQQGMMPKYSGNPNLQSPNLMGNQYPDNPHAGQQLHSPTGMVSPGQPGIPQTTRSGVMPGHPQRNQPGMPPSSSDMPPVSQSGMTPGNPTSMEQVMFQQNQQPGMPARSMPNMPAQNPMGMPPQGLPGMPGQIQAEMHRPGMPPNQSGLPPNQPGMPPSQSGLPPSQPGMPPSHSGMPPSQPGMPPSQPGMPPTQPGMPPSHPGMPPSQPGMHPQNYPGMAPETGMPQQNQPSMPNMQPVNQPSMQYPSQYNQQSSMPYNQQPSNVPSQEMPQGMQTNPQGMMRPPNYKMMNRPYGPGSMNSMGPPYGMGPGQMPMNRMPQYGSQGMIPPGGPFSPHSDVSSQSNPASGLGDMRMDEGIDFDDEEIMKPTKGKGRGRGKGKTPRKPKKDPGEPAEKKPKVRKPRKKKGEVDPAPAVGGDPFGAPENPGGQAGYMPPGYGGPQGQPFTGQPGPGSRFAPPGMSERFPHPGAVDRFQAPGMGNRFPSPGPDQMPSAIGPGKISNAGNDRFAAASPGQERFLAASPGPPSQEKFFNPGQMNQERFAGPPGQMSQERMPVPGQTVPERFPTPGQMGQERYPGADQGGPERFVAPGQMRTERFAPPGQASQSGRYPNQGEMPENFQYGPGQEQFAAAKGQERTPTPGGAERFPTPVGPDRFSSPSPGSQGSGFHNPNMRMPNTQPRRSNNPSGSLAGIMNMVNQMPMPDPESLHARNSSQLEEYMRGQGGGDMPMNPHNNMFQGGMNSNYSQMRMGQYGPNNMPPHSGMGGGPPSSNADMFPQRQYGNIPPQEVPMVPSINQGSRMESPYLPTSRHQSYPVSSSSNPLSALSPTGSSHSQTAKSESGMSHCSQISSSSHQKSHPSEESKMNYSNSENRAPSREGKQTVTISDHTAISQQKESQSLSETAYSSSETVKDVSECSSVDNSKPSTSKACDKLVVSENSKGESCSSSTNKTEKDLISPHTMMLTPPESPKSVKSNVNEPVNSVPTPPLEKESEKPRQSKSSEKSKVKTAKSSTSDPAEMLQMDNNSQRTMDNVSNSADTSYVNSLKSDTVANSQSDNAQQLALDTIPKTNFDSIARPPVDSNKQNCETQSFQRPFMGMDNPNISQSNKMGPPSVQQHLSMPPQPQQSQHHMMSQYYSQSTRQSGHPMHQQNMMMQQMSQSEMGRHPGYGYYQQQQQMMSMHMRMGMPPSSQGHSMNQGHMVSQMMQQSHMMPPYVPGHMGGHMMPSHMQHSQGVPPQNPNTNAGSPGPQYQQL